MLGYGKYSEKTLFLPRRCCALSYYCTVCGLLPGGKNKFSRYRNMDLNSWVQWFKPIFLSIQPFSGSLSRITGYLKHGRSYGQICCNRYPTDTERMKLQSHARLGASKHKSIRPYGQDRRYHRCFFHAPAFR